MNIQAYLINENISVGEMIQKLDANGKGILFICEKEQLKGVVSDGDIRRYMLRGGDMGQAVKSMANYCPKFLPADTKTDVQKYMRECGITAIPLVNPAGEVKKICFDTGESVQEFQTLKVPVVIMAGGKGTRLYPYTQILPKPLIPIGEKTITERIIEQFSHFGCSDITMIVNYKKKFIEAYFSETDSDLKIDFVEEETFGGTGGGLKLLQRMDSTFFMTNCDILVDADYGEILSYHRKAGNILTMVCAKKQIEIPYGTVEADSEGRLQALREKPNFSFLTNTGFYIIEPEFLNKIPERAFIHITDVIDMCIKDGECIGTYIVEEDDWMDMGQLDELEKMRKKFED
ncbi:MAG: NTP transferase domain-containing protein [Lachnospiraceae bacterium]|nr:NTP transferase domain-containing protein [Lachnospiraceae bacterium]